MLPARRIDEPLLPPIQQAPVMRTDSAVRTIAKVTAFVTRRAPSGDGHELLVFRHPDAGIQLPAGSVEPGEAFAAAALREVEEETGLRETHVVAHLGTRVSELHDLKAFCEEARLRTGPSPDAALLATLPRGWWCRPLGQQGDYCEVRYEELDRNTRPEQVIVRFTGWVRSDLLAGRMERAYFHVRCTRPTPERWLQRAEGRFDFECHWLPLLPKPDIRSPQQAWIDEFHAALVQGVAQHGH
jgi:8-oxo-dGTP pyrophosphatase MutT (NUDIX family)